MSCHGKVFRLAERIGSGAYSHVFNAQDVSTGNLYAIKKSRVSLTINRTILDYEARILKLLEGHPAIPKLIGYGRFEHFEYLAIEKLGKTLGDVEHKVKLPIKTVSNIAVQMISVLEHIHNCGIVHRDIKPSNIIASNGHDFSQLRLIDFGLARRCIVGTPQTHDLVKERLNIVGTLSWASLNAYHGVDLNPRDDLESLSFVLLFLLRGDLPWHRFYNAGTAVGRILQIREKMKAWSGSRLCKNYPSIFGDLLDYARNLEFNEPIDYRRFLTGFETLCQSHNNGLELIESSAEPNTPPCPVVPGQLILAQINATTSIGGYTVRHDNSSYWENPLYAGLGDMPFRPAVVSSTGVDNFNGRHKVSMVPICRADTEVQDSLLLSKLHDSSLPLGNASCYVFPDVVEFYCSPDQPPVEAVWKISDDGVQRLISKFCKAGPLILDEQKIQDPSPDVRYQARMQFQAAKFYVNIIGLHSVQVNASSIQGSNIDWTGRRGWLDECVKVARRRGWEDGFRFWTGDMDAGEEEDSEDSYFGNDHSLWENPQRERDEELTLPWDPVDLPQIEQIL